MASQFSRRVVATRVLGTLAAGGLAIGLATRLLSNNKLLADSGEPSKTFKGGPAFMSLPLESSEMVNHNTKRLRFKLKDDAVSGLPLTSSLLTYSWPKGRWTPVLRPYTPVTSSDTPGYLELLVKQYPNGKSSTHLHSLTPGDSLFLVAALPGYKWQPNSYKHVTLIAGGAGITPIYQLAQGILNNPSDKTAVTLVFGVNGDRDVLLRDELRTFEKDYPGRFKAVYTVSNPEADSPYRKGYVDGGLLREVAPKGEAAESKVFVCGPPAMEASLVGARGKAGILQELGYRKDQIHKF